MFLVPLGNFSAVLDPYTGETHFLNDLPALLVSSIGSDPLDVSKLTERLIGHSQGFEHSAQRNITAALASLEQAELIESREPG